MIGFKDWVSGLRQLLTIESPLKMMKNTFYFVLKAIFILGIFTFLSWLFGYVEKRLDKKAKVIVNFFNATDWARNNYNIHIAQYLKK